MNVFSEHDDVLGTTYATAMGEPALGFEGARTPNGDPFPTVVLEPTGYDRRALQLGVEAQAETPYGGPVINVQASAVVSDHSDLTDPPLLDLIWETATYGGK